MALIFTDLGENAFESFTAQYDLSYRFFIDGINQIEEFSPKSWFAEFYHDWVLNFIK